MRQRLFGMLGADIGMSLLAVLDGSLQMRNPFRRMGIRLRLLGRLGMRQRCLGMGYEKIGMALFSMRNGFFGVTDGFGQMILGQGEAWRESDSAPRPRTNENVLRSMILFPPFCAPAKGASNTWGGRRGATRPSFDPRLFRALEDSYKRAHFRA